MLQTPSFSRAFGVRGDVMVFSDGGARQKVVLREYVPMVDFTFLLKPYSPSIL